MEQDVSVIIVNYNTQELTKACIESVKEKTIGLKYDIYVVDNASTDGSKEIIPKLFPDIHFIGNDKNIGFGLANNIAIKRSNAKYVFLLNSDTILVNNAIKILYDYLEADKNESLACCGGALYNNDMSPQISYGRFPKVSQIFSYYFLSKIIPNFHSSSFSMAGYVKDERELEVDYVTGADMLIRKSVLEKVGGFSSDFFLYFEETELCLRFIRNGYTNMICPKAKIIHLCGKSTKTSEASKRLFEESRYIFLKKYKGDFYVMLYKMISVMFSTLSFMIKRKKNV